MSKLTETREFLLKEKMVSFKDQVKVMNIDREELGYFKGKLIKIGNTYRLRDMNENAILTAHEKVISLRSAYTFYKGGETDDDQFIGKLKQKLISIKPSYWFENEKEEKIMTMKGNIFKLKYNIIQDDKVIAEVSKKLFKIKDTYGVKMVPDISDDTAMLLLGIVISLHHEKEEAKKR